jgi:phage regulator Rha-like protein
MLQVIEKNSVLVVDSRLIAEELGIEHRSFKDTIQVNASDLEEHFGQLRRETAPSKANGGGGFGETYYLLTEEQATYLMTLSRNTEQVKKAKLNLVKAFSAAKQSLIVTPSKEITQLLTTLINNQQNQAQQLATLTERTQRLDTVEQEKAQLANQLTEFNVAGSIHQGCYNIIRAEINQQTIVLITATDYLLENGKSITYSKLLARRAASLYRCSRKAEPFKNKQNQMLFERKYLDEAITSISDLLVD